MSVYVKEGLKEVLITTGVGCTTRRRSTWYGHRHWTTSQSSSFFSLKLWGFHATATMTTTTTLTMMMTTTTTMMTMATTTTARSYRFPAALSLPQRKPLSRFVAFLPFVEIIWWIPSFCPSRRCRRCCHSCSRCHGGPFCRGCPGCCNGTEFFSFVLFLQRSV